jgi:hypothetical protein
MNYKDELKISFWKGFFAGEMSMLFLITIIWVTS